MESAIRGIIFVMAIPYTKHLCSALLAFLLTLSFISASYYNHHPYYEYWYKQMMSTKCAYSIVLNEVSPKKCPDIISQQQSDQSSSRRHNVIRTSKATNGDISKVHSELKDLQAVFYKELSGIKDMNMTLKLQRDVLETTQKNLDRRLVNATKNDLEIKTLNDKISKQWKYVRSVEQKILEVMTTVGEMHIMMDKRLPKLGDIDTKIVPVISASKIKNCGLGEDAKYYRDCHHIFLSGHRKSGIYHVTPIYSACPIPVWCDMDTPGGGWLVLMRRSDGECNFNRGWQEYRTGFCDLTEEFWLGNDNIFLLSNQNNFRLRVDLWDFKGSRVYAEYEKFVIDGERNNFRLQIANYSGTAGEGLLRHDGADFSTPDNDNDDWDKYNCAREWVAGWWFTNCWFAFLTGLYSNDSTVQHRGVAWTDWTTDQLMKAEMKIIPIL